MLERHEIDGFLVLAEELHFGHAAERLGLSPGRVSQTIKKLERRIGAPLFARTSRRVVLTPLGEQLRDDLEPVRSRLEEVVERAMAAARGVEGVLRVGFLGSGAGQLGPAIMDLFGAEHPGCEVLMRETHFADPLGPLRSGDVDVLITRLPVDEPDLTVGVSVISEPRVIAVPAGHPFARRASLSFEDLARDTVFGVTGPAPAYWWDFHVPRETPSGRPIPRGQDVATFQELLALIAGGRGISPLVASVARYYGRPDIAFVPCPDLPLSEVAVVWRTQGATARTRAFAQAARAAVVANGGPARY